MATAYLTERRPVRDQWYQQRNRPLTGCTVLHTTESIFDEMGVDTGAENVAEFIRTRTTPGSYHDLVDSDSAIYLVDYDCGAYHDGTGSNNWALSLSFACRTIDWKRMPADKRKAMLRNGALRFAHQQLYRHRVKAPLTRLRLITKRQSDEGMSGFTYHGYRDPGRRSDPGVSEPNLFPMDEFLHECRVALAELMPHHPDALEDDVALTPEEKKALAMIPEMREDLDHLADVYLPGMASKYHDGIAFSVIRKIALKLGLDVDEALSERSRRRRH